MTWTRTTTKSADPARALTPEAQPRRSHKFQSATACSTCCEAHTFAFADCEALRVLRHVFSEAAISFDYILLHLSEAHNAILSLAFAVVDLASMVFKADGRLQVAAAACARRCTR